MPCISEGGGEDLGLRQRPVELLHLRVMPHAGMQLRVAYQQLGHLGVVAASGVAVQRAGEVLLQLVVKPAADKQGAPLFHRILPLQLPEEELAELRPEVKAAHIAAPQHGGAPPERIQQRSGVVVAADDAGQFQIEALKGRQLQQKAAYRQVEAVVDRRFKVAEHLAVHLRGQLGAIGLPRRHVPRDDRRTQRVAGGLPQDGTDLGVCRLRAVGLQQPAYVLAVKQQLLRVEDGHHPRVLKRHKAGGRYAAGEQHEAPPCALADKRVQRLPVPLLLHTLEVVDQQGVPRILRGGQRKAGGPRIQTQNGAPVQQGVGQCRLSEAAGGAEEQNSAALPEGVKRLCGRRLDDDGVFIGHGHPSLRQRRNRPTGPRMTARVPSLSYTSTLYFIVIVSEFPANVNQSKVGDGIPRKTKIA